VGEDGNGPGLRLLELELFECRSNCVCFAVTSTIFPIENAERCGESSALEPRADLGGLVRCAELVEAEAPRGETPSPPGRVALRARALLDAVGDDDPDPDSRSLFAPLPLDPSASPPPLRALEE
jgi:hypothetical protein